MSKFQEICDALHRKPINRATLDAAILDAPEEFPTEKKSKKPLGPGEDAEPKGKEAASRMLSKMKQVEKQQGPSVHTTAEPVPSGLPGSESWNKAKDKNAEYEAEYGNLNKAMAAHKQSQSPESAKALREAEQKYSAARHKALYQRDPAAN